MKRARLIQKVAVCLAAAGLCVPQLALATTPQASHGQVMDVQLREGGALLGQVVTPEYRPIAGIDVVLHSAGREMGLARTDANGHFVFDGLTAGVYQVVTAGGQTTCRAWTQGVAPPGAQSAALVVSGAETARGQHGVKGFLTNPWVIAAIIATAVAVPVALHNAKDPNSN